jgi:polyhydroxybutyrate depolymerase
MPLLPGPGAALGAALALLPSLASAGGLGPGDHEGSFSYDGALRIYDLRVPPSYDGSTPTPLVVDMHGWLSNKTQQAAFSGFRALADAEGFAVAWPQGLYGAPGNPEGINFPAGPSWNAGFCCGQAQQDDPHDVGFLRTLVEHVARRVAVDRRRVYATGLSNGGAMTQRLACEAADVFAAAAPVAFPIALVPIESCQPSRPIAVLTFQGLTDALVPYEGSGLFPAAAASFARWRTNDGCGDGPVDQEVVLGASRCDTDTTCAEGVEAGLCSVLSTSGPPAEGHILYVNDDLDVAETAWSFLDRFALPADPGPLPELVAGKKLRLVGGADASKRKLRLDLEAPPSPLPADPTADGASLQVYNTNGTGESICIPLPASGWRAKRSGLAYEDAAFAHGPCKAAKITAKRAEVSCRGKVKPLDFSLDEPTQGSVGAILRVGSLALCAEFGGTVAEDPGAARFFAKQAPAPGVCQAPRVPCL